MKNMKDKTAHRKRAHQRLRQRVEGTVARPRLSVFKSSRYVYAQVIDDKSGSTLAQASSMEAEVRSGVEAGATSKAAARRVGEVVAERAKSKGITKVVFDRGGYIYHGRVKELAEGARSKGLEF
ncbi:MAG: 50S ribosomal protein L18 [Acidobacteriota bacterium]